MNVANLSGIELDYWVARSLHDFVREIHFTDSGETVSIRGNDRGRPWTAVSRRLRHGRLPRLSLSERSDSRFASR